MPGFFMLTIPTSPVGREIQACISICCASRASVGEADSAAFLLREVGCRRPALPPTPLPTTQLAVAGPITVWHHLQPP